VLTRPSDRARFRARHPAAAGLKWGKTYRPISLGNGEHWSKEAFDGDTPDIDADPALLKPYATKWSLASVRSTLSRFNE
jgi:hypothetical protein